MPTMYKLVTPDWTTHGNMKWAIAKTNKATGKGKEMCTDGVLHCYADPRLAILFNPLHANIKNPIVLKIECSEIITQDGLKFACKEQTPIAQLKLPELSLNQKVAFAIKCALLAYKAKDFVVWAEKWLSGEDRTAYAAAQVEYAANAAANAANAAYAANAAAYAAYAAYAANAAYAENAAYAAAHAANAAAYAENAAYAANEVANQFRATISWVMENIK